MPRQRHGHLSRRRLINVIIIHHKEIHGFEHPWDYLRDRIAKDMSSSAIAQELTRYGKGDPYVTDAAVAYEMKCMNECPTEYPEG